VTTQGNHFNGPRAIYIIFYVGKYVKTKCVKEIPICIIIGIPPHNVINNKSVPLDPRNDLLEPWGGARKAFMQPIVPYFRPFRRPLNHPKYKKDSNSDAHVQALKSAIKINNETIYEEIINMFNFTLWNNALD
jgi:hypothetical protein